MNILPNLRFAFNRNRWRNVVAASAAALVIATGTATAVTLTIDLPRTYEGLVEINTAVIDGAVPGYVVPAGKKLMITDVIFANPSATTTIFVRVWQGSGVGCSNATSANEKITGVVVPRENTIDLSLTTGLYFGPGEVCIGSPNTVHVTMSGYLFR